ncbi:DNA adenine methylase [Acetobacteraceae bacterium]|nr:DNA adenine methylase [Acetobacteraceae bacterium]
MKYISPFRYPGGKSWLVPKIKAIAQEWYPQGLDKIIEPFCGGASVSLDSIAKGWAKKAHLNDLDEKIYNFWNVLIGGIIRVNGLSDSNCFFNCLQRTKTPEDFWCSYPEETSFEPSGSPWEEALKTLILNRTSFTGSIYPALSGKMGKGHTRWNQEKLFKRCQLINEKKDQLDISNLDWFDFLETHQKSNALFYIDPPYITAGKKLYRHYNVSLPDILNTTRKLKGGVIISYEDDEQAEMHAKCQNFWVQRVKMPAGKTELLFLKEPEE